MMYKHDHVALEYTIKKGLMNIHVSIVLKMSSSNVNDLFSTRSPFL